jgi:anti-sigma factor RsiW
MQKLIHGYLDGELDLLSNLRVEEHLQDCPVCTRSYQNHKALRSALNTNSLYFTAPVRLKKRLVSRLRADAKGDPRRGILSWRWMLVGCSLALVVIFIVVLPFIHSNPGRDDLLAQEIVSGHVRSMMANHLTDVASADQHTVKPWFDSKLDYSPPVTDLTTQGFPLIGGRLDYIGNRSVAALVFQRRQHLINLYVWPEPAEVGTRNRMFVRQGYNLIYWNRAGMDYWAISDLNVSELQEFTQALQHST